MTRINDPQNDHVENLDQVFLRIFFKIFGPMHYPSALELPMISLLYHIKRNKNVLISWSSPAHRFFMICAQRVSVDISFGHFGCMHNVHGYD